LTAVRNGHLDLAASKPVDVTDNEAEGSWVRPGVFYVVRGNGNRSLVGRGAEAPNVVAPSVLYPDLLIQIVVNQDLVLPDYLRLSWDNHETRADLEARTRTSAGIHKINQKNLGEVTLPLPQLDEQRRIVGILGGNLAAATEVRHFLETQLAALNSLPAALLRLAS
jgi:type I restriction enzyme S subunit